MIGDDVGTNNGEDEDVSKGEKEAEEEENTCYGSHQSRKKILFSEFFVIQSVDDRQEAHSLMKHFLDESLDTSTHFSL